MAKSGPLSKLAGAPPKAKPAGHPHANLGPYLHPKKGGK